MRTIDYDLQLLMPDTVTVELAMGRDGYNRVIYGPATSYRCRVEQSTSLVRDQDGRERISNTQIYLYTKVFLKHDSRIVFADGSTYPIMSIDTTPDEYGDLFTKVSM